MSAQNSALVSVIGRGFDGLDVPSLAQDLGATFAQLNDLGTTLDQILVTVPEGDVVLQGTGVMDFDAKAAAALGIPFVLITKAPARTSDLALAHARSVEAEVLGAFTAVASVPGAL